LYYRCLSGPAGRTCQIAGAPRRLTVAFMPAAAQGNSAFLLWRIHVHGNAVQSLCRRRKNVPAAFILHESQKILLTIHLELHSPTSPWSKKPATDFHGFSRTG
jgi:hypothetical protein